MLPRRLTRPLPEIPEVGAGLEERGVFVRREACSAAASGWHDLRERMRQGSEAVQLGGVAWWESEGSSQEDRVK